VRHRCGARLAEAPGLSGEARVGVGDATSPPTCTAHNFERYESKSWSCGFFTMPIAWPLQTGLAAMPFARIARPSSWRRTRFGGYVAITPTAVGESSLPRGVHRYALVAAGAPSASISGPVHHVHWPCGIWPSVATACAARHAWSHLLNGPLHLRASAPAGLMSDCRSFAIIDVGTDPPGDVPCEAINHVLAILAGEPLSYNRQGQILEYLIERHLGAVTISAGLSFKPLQFALPPHRGSAGWWPRSRPASCRGGGRAAGHENKDSRPISCFRNGGKDPTGRNCRMVCARAGRKPIRPFAGVPGASSWPREVWVERARLVADAPDSPIVLLHASFDHAQTQRARPCVKTAARALGAPDCGATFDSVCDSVVASGSPNRVVDEILAFREQVGISAPCSMPAGLGSTRTRPPAPLVRVADKVRTRRNSLSA